MRESNTHIATPRSTRDEYGPSSSPDAKLTMSRSNNSASPILGPRRVNFTSRKPMGAAAFARTPGPVMMNDVPNLSPLMGGRRGISL